jgi:hypothetical protein
MNPKLGDEVELSNRTHSYSGFLKVCQGIEGFYFGDKNSQNMSGSYNTIEDLFVGHSSWEKIVFIRDGCMNIFKYKFKGRVIKD